MSLIKLFIGERRNEERYIHLLNAINQTLKKQNIDRFGLAAVEAGDKIILSMSLRLADGIGLPNLYVEQEHLALRAIDRFSVHDRRIVLRMMALKGLDIRTVYNPLKQRDPTLADETLNIMLAIHKTILFKDYPRELIKLRDELIKIIGLGEVNVLAIYLDIPDLLALNAEMVQQGLTMIIKIHADRVIQYIFERYNLPTQTILDLSIEYLNPVAFRLAIDHGAKVDRQVITTAIDRARTEDDQPALLIYNQFLSMSS